MSTITAGSHSRLSVFEDCPRRAQLAFVDRIPEPDRGPPPAKYNGEWPNDRGSRVHDELEQYIRGNRPNLSTEAASFSSEFKRARQLFKTGKAVMEEMWCFDEEWNLVHNRAFNKIRFRIKCDLTVFTSSTEAVVVDYKTGRSFGNEIKHGEQMQIYQLGGFLKYPQLKKVTTELWYLDEDHIRSMVFTRDQGLRFWKGISDRNSQMLNATEFPARPSKSTCKWCPYSKKGTGHCQEGVV